LKGTVVWILERHWLCNIYIAMAHILQIFERFFEASICDNAINYDVQEGLELFLLLLYTPVKDKLHYE
jgi:hypothetical protein